MDEFIYLKTDESKILFNEFTYVKYRDAETLGETTYRCNQCKCVSLRTKLTDKGERVVSKSGKHKNTCILIGPPEVACIIKYEELKTKCLEPGFIFAKQYPQSLLELQKDYDNKVIASHWPSKATAKECIKSIRRRRDQTLLTSIPVNTETLELSEDMQYIIVNKVKKLFLQYDNQDKTGNRILVFFSDTGAEIMKAATNWHIDGSFKNCPKIFKKMLTIQCIIKNDALSAAFILLQSKTRDTYTAAFTGMQNAYIGMQKELLKEADQLAPVVILLDFEVSMQQACIKAFISVLIKG